MGKGQLRRRDYQRQLWAPPETPQAAKRQARAAKYTGGPSPEEELPSLPHQLEVAWPHSYESMGKEFMDAWKKEAKDCGLSLRLSSHRNSVWKRNPAQAASTYILKITGDAARPDQEQRRPRPRCPSRSRSCLGRRSSNGGTDRSDSFFLKSCSGIGPSPGPLAPIG